jgi:hypothetical protein
MATPTPKTDQDSNMLQNQGKPNPMLKTGTFGMLGKHKSSAKRQMMYDSFVENKNNSSAFRQQAQGQNQRSGRPTVILNDSTLNKMAINPPNSRIQKQSTPITSNQNMNYSNVPSTQVKRVIRYSHSRKPLQKAPSHISSKP